MNKSKIISIIIWLLLFALSAFLLLIIPTVYTPAIWTTLIFDIIAFASQFIIWALLKGKSHGPKDGFYRYPGMTMAAVYLIIQFVICLITAFTANIMSLKLSLIINFVVMIIMWVLMLTTVLSKEHIERVDSRQKDHHVEL